MATVAWVVISLALSASGHYVDSPEVDSPEVDSPEGDSGLRADLATYLQAQKNSITLQGTRDGLGFRVLFFANAWHQEVIERLAEAVEKKRSPSSILPGLRAMKSHQRRRLDGKPGFRIDLKHPDFREERQAGESEAVQFFEAKLTNSVTLFASGKRVVWKVGKVPDLEALPVLRVARHYTLKNHRRVPFISPQKPKKSRFVFRGENSSIHGIFGPRVLAQKTGVIILKLSYEELDGPYDDRHIIDLNEAQTVWSPEVHAQANADLPLQFPELPESLEAFIAKVDEKAPGGP